MIAKVKISLKAYTTRSIDYSAGHEENLLYFPGVNYGDNACNVLLINYQVCQQNPIVRPFK